MKKSVIYFILILLVIAGLTTYIIKRSNVEEGDNKADTTQTEGDSKSEDKDKEEDKKDEKEKPKKQEEITGDYTGFSSSTQEVGTFVEEDKFILESITDSSKAGYHEFVFNLKGPSEPKVTARYDANSNVIKLEITNIEKDNSGIAYQGERAINKDGILRLYRNVSGAQTKSFYDIGLSQSTIFKLDLISKSSEQNTWSVILNVKYPGEREISGNLGSTEFSLENQSISGVGEDKGATISSFAYSASGGILKLTFDVSATGDTPIPMASAKYNDDRELVLTFESLRLDRAVKSLNGQTLPTGVSVTTSREGEKSIYTFTKGSRAQFKLSAILSPNQVILEIK